jgi:hypothetical protein
MCYWQFVVAFRKTASKVDAGPKRTVNSQTPGPLGSGRSTPHGIGAKDSRLVMDILLAQLAKIMAIVRSFQ